ncbi:MAG: radical SAM protein [Mariprofundaceae bacterium]|nr:radical SAM protein [Mariprofundaceae bacterium]
MVLAVTTPSGVTLETTSGPVMLERNFADSIIRLISRTATVEDEKRVGFIERQYPQLDGIAAFRTSAELSGLLKGDALGMLFVEMTSQCNESCIHCYADSSPERSESLSLDEIRAGLSQAREMGRAFVQFTGGDPLIHPHLADAVACAHSLDFAGIEIYTNGILLSDRLLGKLKPFSPGIAFSLYSHDAATHDTITALPGSFRRTTSAIRRARAAGFSVRIGVVLMRENASQAVETRDYIVNQLEIDEAHIRFDPVKKTGRGADIEQSQGITFSAAHLPDRKKAAGRNGKLCIAANGTVYPCIFSRQNPLGHIRHNSLQEMMERLNRQTLAEPSASRWQSCQDRLSCTDCQMIAYALGEKSHG